MKADRDRLRYVLLAVERDLDNDREERLSSRKNRLRDAEELDRRAQERRLAALRAEERDLRNDLKRGGYEPFAVHHAELCGLLLERSASLPERRRAYRQVAYREDDRVTGLSSSQTEASVLKNSASYSH